MPVNYATRNAAGFLVFTLCVIVLQIFATGPRLTSEEMIFIFRIYSGEAELGSVAQEFHYLIEGILPNLLGLPIYFSGLKIEAVVAIWWAIGLAVEAAVLLYCHRRGYVSGTTIVFLMLLTPWVKESLSWIGKPDPYLLSALFLVAFLPARSRMAYAAITVAVFCHPPLAVLGTFGVVAARYIFEGRMETGKIVAVIASYALFKIVMWIFFTGGVGRDGYVLQHAAIILVRGAEHMLPFMTMVLAVPTILYLLLREEPGFTLPRRENHPAVSAAFAVGILLPAVIACFLVIDNTRVFTLATLPFFAVAFESRKQALEALFEKRPRLVLALAALVLFSPELDQRGWTGV